MGRFLQFLTGGSCDDNQLLQQSPVNQGESWDDDQLLQPSPVNTVKHMCPFVLTRCLETDGGDQC